MTDSEKKRFNDLPLTNKEKESFSYLIENLSDTFGCYQEHDKRTLEIYEFISKLDFILGDYFCFKSGGDGDNGEILMSELDEYFKFKERLN